MTILHYLAWVGMIWLGSWLLLSLFAFGCYLAYRSEQRRIERMEHRRAVTTWNIAAAKVAARRLV